MLAHICLFVVIEAALRIGKVLSSIEVSVRFQSASLQNGDAAEQHERDTLLHAVECALQQGSRHIITRSHRSPLRSSDNSGTLRLILEANASSFANTSTANTC